tara:strand:+ start:1272 stop:1505 length:234 start_codon:yes stop_codon:yes gene_type:complete
VRIKRIGNEVSLHKEIDVTHSGERTKERYVALAKKINDEINYMVENCKLELELEAEPSFGYSPLPPASWETPTYTVA